MIDIETGCLRRRLLGLAGALALVVFFSGCDLRLDPKMDAERGEPTSGRVMDAATRAPIPGAFVVMQWMQTQSNLAGTTTRCVYLQVHRSGADGEVTIETYQGYLPTGVIFYAPGYAKPLWEVPTKGEFLMSQFVGTASEHYKQLRERFLVCLGDLDSGQKLVEFDRAVLAEMRAVASTEDERKGIEDLVDIYTNYRWKPLTARSTGGDQEK